MKHIKALLIVSSLILIAGCAAEEPTDETQPLNLDPTAPYQDAPSTIMNGGFENGDLSHWTSEGLAFTSNGVTRNATYWPEMIDFNHDGDYHLYGAFSAPERMDGRLKSNVFKVAGEGHVSFLLGAGRVHETTYVRLMDAVGEEELDRVVNTAFEDPGNANSYHAYSFDLDDYVDDYVYIELVDENTEGGFGYINADAFEVHYD